MESLINLVQTNAMVVSAAVLITAYIFIASEKIPKVTVALVGASLTLLLGLLGQNAKTEGVLNPHYFINYVDFNVIFLLVYWTMLTYIFHHETNKKVHIYIYNIQNYCL